MITTVITLIICFFLTKRILKGFSYDMQFFTWVMFFGIGMMWLIPEFTDIIIALGLKITATIIVLVITLLFLRWEKEEDIKKRWDEEMKKNDDEIDWSEFRP